MTTMCKCRFCKKDMPHHVNFIFCIDCHGLLPYPFQKYMTAGTVAKYSELIQKSLDYLAATQPNKEPVSIYSLQRENSDALQTRLKKIDNSVQTQLEAVRKCGKVPAALNRDIEKLKAWERMQARDRLPNTAIEIGEALEIDDPTAIELEEQAVQPAKE